MSVVDAFAEISAWFEPALGGWRYLFAPDYRAKKHAEWSYEHRGYVILDVAGGVIGVGVSLALLVILVLLFI